MNSADAWLLRAPCSLPGKVQLASPLPSQSKSGPTSSLSSAMNPSRETAATPMIVLPMIQSFRFPDSVLHAVAHMGHTTLCLQSEAGWAFAIHRSESGAALVWIGGPRRVTSGIGCMAHSGGSVPWRSAAMRAK